MLAGHRGHPWWSVGGIRPAASFPWGQAVMLVPLVEPDATQPVPGLGVCSLALAFAATGRIMGRCRPGSPCDAPAGLAPAEP